ncbi:MAG: hypothetical protein AAFP82_17770, partial [Bacteroidota bacterium]
KRTEDLFSTTLTSLLEFTESDVRIAERLGDKQLVLSSLKMIEICTAWQIKQDWAWIVCPISALQASLSYISCFHTRNKKGEKIRSKL